MCIAAKALSVITGPLFSVIDKAVTDKDEAARLKHESQTQLIDAENSALKVILAEAAGESWLQRNWRPILMLTIVAIVANNYLIAPYLSAMFGVGLTLPLPEALWNLMTLGVGGYIAGQTAERGISTWQSGQVAREQAKAQQSIYQQIPKQ
ncbi:3TM-type holin [Vreelandella sp. 2A-K22]